MISQFKKLLRNQRGAAIVEFAIVGPVALLLLCGVIENGLVLFQQSLLDNATRDAARLIQTGQVYQAGSISSTFTNQLCTDVGAYIPCGSLQFNVQSGSSFSALNTTVTATSSGNMSTQGFDPGGPGDDVAVQVGYNRTYLIPLVGKYMAVSSSNSTLLVSTVIFQNEPFIE